MKTLRWAVSLFFCLAVFGFSAQLPPALPIVPPVLPWVQCYTWTYKATNNSTVVRLYTTTNLLAGWNAPIEFYPKTNLTRITNAIYVTNLAVVTTNFVATNILAVTNFEYEGAVRLSVPQDFFKVSVSNSAGERWLQ